MLLLINTNRMLPPIAPVGLDYVAGAARRAVRQIERRSVGKKSDGGRE